MAEITTDVLIIGTGPAGCSCAALLSSYGIDNMVVNRYRWLANTPRAHITNQRTMEVLRDLGHDVEAEAYIGHRTGSDGRKRILRKPRGRRNWTHEKLGHTSPFACGT